MNRMRAGVMLTRMHYWRRRGAINSQDPIFVKSLSAILDKAAACLRKVRGAFGPASEFIPVIQVGGAREASVMIRTHPPRSPLPSEAPAKTGRDSKRFRCKRPSSSRRFLLSPLASSFPRGLGPRTALLPPKIGNKTSRQSPTAAALSTLALIAFDLI